MLFTFSSIHHLIFAEELLKGANFPLKVLPLPPYLAKGCGMGLLVQAENPSVVKNFLVSSGVIPKGIYREEKGSYKREKD